MRDGAAINLRYDKVRALLAYLAVETRQPLRRGLLANLPIEKIREFETEYLNLLEMKHKNILNLLKEGKLNDDVEKTMTDVAKEIVDRLK